MNILKKKSNYSPPVIRVLDITMEHCLAASSATIKPGASGTAESQDTPQATDWTINDIGGSKKFDF